MLQILTDSDHWPLWRAARVAALTDAPDAFPNAAQAWGPEAEARWHERLLDPAALKIVAVANGEPVGLVRGSLEEGVAWLSSLWVRPDQRGTGLARELMTAVEEWARAHTGVLRLCVVPGNERAITVYRRLGYRLLPATEDGFLHFEKPLRQD